MKLKDKAGPPGSPEEWLEFAEGDLQPAELARARSGIQAGMICFHLQQAVLSAGHSRQSSAAASTVEKRYLDAVSAFIGAENTTIPIPNKHRQ